MESRPFFHIGVSTCFAVLVIFGGNSIPSATANPLNVCILLRKGYPCNITVSSHAIPITDGYRLQFGDSSSAVTFTDISTVTTHTYNTVGTYTVTLTINPTGSNNVYTKTITVKEVITNVTIHMPSFLCVVGEYINFTSTIVPDIPVTSYSKLGSANWTNGSLIMCNEVGAQSLAIFIENGISAVVMKCLLNVTVVSMNFTWSPTYYAAGAMVPFTITKPGGNYGLIMVFPGAVTINCTNDTIYFSFATPNISPGYEVSLIATDNAGNAAKITKNIMIFPTLNGTLNVDYPAFGGIGLLLEYKVIITADNISHSFDFGDSVINTTLPIATRAFPSQGQYCVTITTRNPVSSLSKTVCTKIVQTIQGLSCAEDLIRTPLGQPSAIGFVIENGTDFDVKLQINALLPTYKLENATAHDIFVIYKQHNYTQVGEYTSTVTASNIVGNATAQCLILVQEPIQNLNVSLIHDTEVLEMNATLKVIVTVNGTSPLIEYNYGDGTPAFNTTVLTMHHRYQMHGSFFINITARNNVSEMTINRTIFVPKPVVPLQRLLIRTVPVNFSNPTTLSMRIGQGSDFNCTVDYGNGITNTYCYTNMIYFENAVSLDVTPFMNLDLSESYVYPKEGYYYLNVHCFNRLSNVTNITDAYVLKPITDFVLTPQPPQIFGSDITIPFTMVAGTNVTVYYFIDGQQMDNTSYVTDTGGSFLMKPYQHYSQVTHYEIKAYASNMVSQYNSTSYIMTLQIPITELTCNISTTTPHPDVGIRRCRNESSIFPAEHPIIFPANPNNGTNLTCFYSFGDGILTNTSNLTVTHQYAMEHRRYEPTVTCSNLVSSVTCCYPITMEMKVKSLTVSNNGPKKFNKTISFTLSTEEYGTGTCFSWDFRDGTPIHVFGESHCSKLTFPQGQQFFQIADGTALINAYHAYSTVNQFFVRVQATNNVSCIETENQAVSVLKECFYPNVSMRVAGENASMAAQIRRSETLQVSNVVDVYCEVSSVTNYSWIITRVQDINNDTLNPPEVMSLPNVKLTAPIPTILPRTLPYGTYEFNVTVYMVGTIGVRTIEIGYFAIVCTPYIIANIKDGCLLKRKSGSVIQVDGRSTRDLDHEEGDHSNMTFYWFCRKQSETLSTVDPESVPFVQLPSKSADNNTLTSGGCFGTGKGRLNYNTTNITLDTSLPGIDVKESLVVTLLVVKNDSCGIRIGTFDQTIQLTTDAIPILSTTCIQNCDVKVNSNQKLSYETTCEGCDAGTTFKWEIFQLKSCDGGPLDPINMEKLSDQRVEEMIAGGIGSLHMVIPDNKLDGDKCYTFKVNASKENGLYGDNAFTIQTNDIPHSGSMSITPLTGTALNTTYSINLENWIDNDLPLTYECGIRQGEDFKILVKNQEVPMKLKLQAGDPQNDDSLKIECKIIDRAGASTVESQTVQVKPMNITGDKLLDFLNYTINSEEGPLNNAIQKADFAGIFQLTYSVCNMMEDMYNAGEEAKKQNLTEEQKQVLQEEADRRAELKRSLLITLSTVDMGTLTDGQFMAGAVNELTKGYKDLDSTSQELALVILDNVKNQLLNAPVSETGFTDIIETCKSLMSAMTQIGMSSAIAAAYNSTDSQFNVTGITTNNNLTGMVSNTDRAKDRVLGIIDGLNEIGERIQDSMLAGETFVVLKTGNLNCTIGKAWYTQLGGMIFGDGLSEIVFPLLSAMGLTISDPTKDYANLMSTSMVLTLYSWSNTSSLVKSQDVAIKMGLPSHQPIDTSHFTESASIYIPRNAEEIAPMENNFMRIYKEEDNSIQFLQIHSFELSSPDEATHIQIFSQNGSHQYQVFLQYNERAYPEPGNYLHNWTLPDFSSCNIRYSNVSKSVTVGNTTYQIFEVVPKRDCLTDPNTVFIPYSLVNKTGTFYVAIYYNQQRDPNPSDSPLSRKKRAIPDAHCGGHGRMKRSCVIIPPPPPKPTTDPPYGASRLVGTRPPNVDFLGRPIDFNNTMYYDVRIYKTNCLFFDRTSNAWGNNGCTVGNETRKDRVQCKCNHFTSFGSDFFVAPNPIDFDKVFSADLSKNPVVLSVVCSIFGLYLILAIFARRADKADEKKTGVTPLPANTAPGSHSYLVSIHTGARINAGTTANVCIVLSGERGEAPPVLLKDPERPLFTRGADNSLVMTIPFDVGRLTHVRLWHDNTGDNPSWYLSRVAIEDLHTRKKSYFVCERWLAVEEDDGRVDRILPVASKKELTQFSHLFVGKTVQELGDGHLWFSIITRPPQSVFTRLQRLSCGISLLYCTMITSCMFYNTGGGQENPTYIFYIGSLKIDLRQMVIGLQSSLIVFPVNLLLVQIFRKIRPNEPANSNIDDDVSEAFENISSFSDEEERSEKTEEKKKKKKEKKKGLHPRWRYLAWTVFVLSTSVSATFTVFYSLSWGPEIANKWLVAFVLSFFQSVLLIQPVKVLFASIVFALIIRKPIATDDETQEDLTDTIESNNKKSIFADELGCYDKGVAKGPPDEFMLMQARQKRLKEIQMSTILREIFAYFIFLGVLLLVAYGNRDTNAYLLRKSLIEQFVQFTDENMFGLGNAGDADSFWHWARETLIPGLYPGVLYNNKSDKYTGFISDRNNYLVGISRLRLERVKNDSCTIAPVFQHEFSACLGGYSVTVADTKDYDIGWEYLNKSATTSIARKRRSIEEQFLFAKGKTKLVKHGDSSKVKQRVRRAIEPIYVSTSGRQQRRRVKSGDTSKIYFVLDSAVLPDGSIMSCPARWMYHNPLELRGFPYWGKLNFYSGGGYPADLGYDYSTALTVVADVNSHNWVGPETRAVFVEFTVYNANTNLFGVAFLFMEFLPNGGAFPSAEFAIARLYSYVGPFAKLILAMEVVMLLFMFYFMYREIKMMVKQKRQYFHGFWNWLEVVLIILEFVMVIFFFARMWETDKNFIKFHDNPKAFTSFQYASASDMTLAYVIGILVFLVTLRFLKLLRFNKKMAFIGNTIGFIAKPIGLFMISFSIIFFAYGSFAHLIFGPFNKNFKTLLSTSVTQMRILLGDFDYYDIESSDRVLGPLYFFTYMYVVVFFLMNMFLAIINDSFAEVKEMENELSNEYEMVEFILERFKSQFNFMRRPNKHIKTPLGFSPDIPFWEYKHRRDSIWSDSEFSTNTDYTAIKTKRNTMAMGKDLDDLLDRLGGMHIEDVESDELLMKSLQYATSRPASETTSIASDF